MNLDALAEKLLADIRLCDSRDEFDEVVRAALAQARADALEEAIVIVNLLRYSGDIDDAIAAIRAMEVKP